MTIAENLKAANDKLIEAVLPLIKAYEQDTGLGVESVAVQRLNVIGGRSKLISIQVRTNADSL